MASLATSAAARFFFTEKRFFASTISSLSAASRLCASIKSRFISSNFCALLSSCAASADLRAASSRARISVFRPFEFAFVTFAAEASG